MCNSDARLTLAKEALLATGYFTVDQLGDDIAPRITELHEALIHGRGSTDAFGTYLSGYLPADEAKNINHVTRLFNDYSDNGWRFAGWSKDVQNGTFYMFERKG
jgi:hypothetical protein